MSVYGLQKPFLTVWYILDGTILTEFGQAQVGMVVLVFFWWLPPKSVAHFRNGQMWLKKYNLFLKGSV